MLKDIDFTAGWGWVMADYVEVTVELEEVVVVLGSVGRVKVVLAAKVCEGAFLPKLDRLSLDGNGQGCGCRLFRVNFMVGEFVCPILACGQI